MPQDTQPPLLSAATVTRTIDSGYTTITLTDEHGEVRTYRVSPHLVLHLAKAFGNGAVLHEHAAVSER